MLKSLLFCAAEQAVEPFPPTTGAMFLKSKAAPVKLFCAATTAFSGAGI